MVELLILSHILLQLVQVLSTADNRTGQGGSASSIQSFLPPEVVANVVQQSHHLNKYVFNTFSRVCRSWSKAFRPALFYRLSLRELTDVETLGGFLRSPGISDMPHISSYISYITFEPFLRDRESLYGCTASPLSPKMVSWLPKMFLTLKRELLVNHPGVIIYIHLNIYTLPKDLYHQILPHTVQMIRPHCQGLVLNCEINEANVADIYQLVANLHVSESLVVETKSWLNCPSWVESWEKYTSTYAMLTLPKYANTIFNTVLKWKSMVTSEQSVIYSFLCLLGNRKVNNQVYAINAQDLYSIAKLMHHMIHILHSPPEGLYFRIGHSTGSNKHICKSLLGIQISHEFNQ